MSSTATDVFETYRGKLTGIAYRITGSVFEAEDIVHETFLKWYATDHEQIHSPYAWLATVATRLSLDHLKTSWVQRQSYIGPWLPEPFIADKDTPEQDRELDESVTMALLVILDKLSPEERASFILHDLFDFNFNEIAGILDKTGVSCRKLASRARAKIEQEELASNTGKKEHKEVVVAFFEAVKDGNLTSLVSTLKDNVTFHSDGGGKAAASLRILAGSEEVSAFLLKNITANLAVGSAHIRHIWFNGSPGLVAYKDNLPVSAFNFHIENRKITRIHALRNPDKLRLFKEHLK